MDLHRGFDHHGVALEGFAALALAFVPPSWLEELTEDEYREAMQVK
jgi:hypothetical protein